MAIVAIICITALDVALIVQKMNGTVTATVIGAIGTIIGLVFGVTYKQASKSPE